MVDLARDDNGREVALKRLSLHGTPEELAKARQRIRREAEVLRKLDHPAIVALLEVFPGRPAPDVCDRCQREVRAGRVAADRDARAVAAVVARVAREPARRIDGVFNRAWERVFRR